MLPFARPSRDLDLELGARDLNELLDILELASADARQHGIIFEWSTPEMSVHDGAQARVVARFGKSVAHFHLDVEFGTQRVPGMHTRRVPSIVPGLPDLVVNAFPREAAIADKLHAIYRHGPVNTRMGDYYYLFQMADVPIRDDVLQLCLERAFRRFGHRMPHDWSELTGLSDEFVEDRSTMWLRMLDRYSLREWAPSEFEDVVDRIREIAARAFGEAPEVEIAISKRAGFAYRPSF